MNGKSANGQPAADPQSLLRSLPSVDKLLATSAAQTLIIQYGYDSTLTAIRAVLNSVRLQIRSAENLTLITVDTDGLLAQAADQLEEEFRPTLRPVINATGVIIHTNLGRAPLSAAARQAMLEIATGYSTLEYDLDNGKRGSRLLHAGELLTQITGAEAALIVNNNAAAAVLMLAALAKDKEVIVSRGQLVEIGGGFRVPDIMRQSGAKLVEVGTTNRTRAADYERAITPDTALLMRVHASNFKQIGFTESAPMEELADIAHRHGRYLVDDLGSGTLLDTSLAGLEHEPMVQESLAAGADLVAFSGDKLLGGPQAGILVGKRELINQLKMHPLARAIRADKLCLAALTATLYHYRKGEAQVQIPVWEMILRSLPKINAKAREWLSYITYYCDKLRLDLVDGVSTIGGGSLPGATLPTTLLRIRGAQPDLLTARLRQARVPVIARIMDDAVVFDPRTILPEQENQFLESLIGVICNGNYS
ncbi:MAG TPA: L-seryl-tRNA(Sec) selenium transferase [Phototrophicaceae bacterium]|nr:L-seryl-tRNA(Sec) selenium transferase [Phototrophicaceae bacterium]